MPYYVYELVADNSIRFEFKQSIHDERYTRHPESGEPIRRIIVPGIAIRTVGLKRSAVVDKSSPAATACGCASNASLAAAMVANSRSTPSYGSAKSAKRTAQASSHGHGHQHGRGCAGHKH